jgi:polyphosphate kinase 2 (PPK2 family)
MTENEAARLRREIREREQRLAQLFDGADAAGRGAGRVGRGSGG